MMKLLHPLNGELLHQNKGKLVHPNQGKEYQAIGLKLAPRVVVNILVLIQGIDKEIGNCCGGSQNNSKGRIAREAKGLDVGDGDGGSLLDALIEEMFSQEILRQTGKA